MISAITDNLESGDHKIVYLLMLICGAMILDFISGCIAARVCDDIKFTTQRGINGILKKVASLILLLYFVSLAPLVPGVGVSLLYVLFSGYLLMEIQSILVNYKKIGLDVGAIFLFE